MEQFKFLKNRLRNRTSELLNVMDASALPEILTDSAIQEWRATCLGLEQQMAEDIVRIAVVGPIKSGKSTIVNSLFRGDYLKRGAGVVTSMVTRVRRGDRLCARIFFKPWKEINAELSRAVIMLPAIDLPSEREGLDIRDSETRRALSRALADLPRESLIARDSRNINSVLLANYLAGYNDIQSIVTEKIETLQFDQKEFARHRNFVADDRLAVYLKDIQLEINAEEIDPGIEIADCQGSDSPNPLHLAKIQDYLLRTNLIIYVISSRTGMRQADINFLTMIDRMGIAENLLFVINCDFNEHESQASLDHLLQRITDEITLIRPSPEVHAFSGLFHLFQVQNSELRNTKEIRMLEQWRQEEALVTTSEERRRTFEDSLRHQLNHRRYSLLLKNHAERLSLAASGLYQWASTNLRMLAENEESAQATIDGTKEHKKRLERAGDMFKNTLDGSARKLKKELKAEIDRFFDPRSGEVLPAVLSFIKNDYVDLEKYESALSTSGFSNTLYMIFQEFQQKLDGFITETINPTIMGFIKKLENRTSAYFEEIAGSYDAMTRQALAEYRQAMQDFGLNASMEEQITLGIRNLEFIKQQWTLRLPPAVFIMNYTGKIRTEAVMRLGVYSAGNMLRKILKRPTKKENKGELQALEDGMRRIRKETEKSIAFHFKSYRENIKFQYVLKLADAVAESFYKTILDRFSAYNTDLANIREVISKKRIDKEQLAEILNNIKQTSFAVHNDLRQFITEVANSEQ